MFALFRKPIRCLTNCLIFALSILLVGRIVTADPHPCPGNAEDWRIVEIAENLFRVKLRHLRPDERKSIVDSTYNGYDCGHNHGFYLRGGHGGHDFDFIKNNHQKFYALTSGIVMAAGEGDNNVIAIYDQRTKLMVLYLHASSVEPAVKKAKGKWIAVGTPLGNQGDKSHQEIGYHVHVEVRKLTPQQMKLPFEEQIAWLIQPSWGTSDEERPTIPPIPKLYDLMQWHLAEKRSRACLEWGAIKAQCLERN